MKIHNADVKGKVIDKETRCTHYHSQLDRIAIKFFCCQTYYPCIHCHIESAGHAVSRWPVDQFDNRAVLCGACGFEMTIHEYIKGNVACPNCQASFNPGCEKHYHLYFSLGEK